MKKTIIIILSLTFFSLGAFWWFMQNKSTATLNTSEEEIFPLGELRDFFSGNESPPNTSATTDIRGGETRTITMNDLRQISDEPITTYNIDEFEETGLVYYMDKKTGHIYESDLQKNTRVANYTITDTIKAEISKIGTDFNLITQTETGTIKKIDLYSPTEKEESKVTPEIPGLASTTSSSKISEIAGPNQSFDLFSNQLFVLQNFNDGVIGLLINKTTLDQEKIFSSPLTNWRANWINSRMVALQTKPSFMLSGSLYYLTLDGKTKKILSNIPGLVTKISLDSNKVLLSRSSDKEFISEVYDLLTNKTLNTKFKTIADKCAWNQESTIVYCGVPVNAYPNNYPDDWYKGKMQLKDSIWGYDTENDIAVPLYKNSGDLNIDVTKVSITKDKIFFINKNDGKLWLFDLGSLPI